MSSDLATTPLDVTGYLQTVLEGITGMSADLVKFGVQREPPGPKAITYRLVNVRADEAGGTLRSERYASTYELRLYTQTPTDTPAARDAAALAFWVLVRRALYVDKTLAGKVRNVFVGDLIPPGAAADIGEPNGTASTTVTVVWNYSISA